MHPRKGTLVALGVHLFSFFSPATLQTEAPVCSAKNLLENAGICSTKQHGFSTRSFGGERLRCAFLTQFNLFENTDCYGFNCFVWNSRRRGACCVVCLFAEIASRPRAHVQAGSVAEIPNSQGVHVVLYQYQTCPFCNKVRAYLDMQKIPFTVVEVNPLFKGEMAFSKEYRNVPIAVVNGTQVNNSADIIKHVDSLLGSGSRPSGAMSDTEVAEWCAWVDETLARTLAPNIYRTWDEALASFDYITDNSNFGRVGGAVTKYTGAVAMYAIGKRLKKRYGYEDERQALYSAVTQWLTHGVADKPFAGGEQPNTADVEVFGVLRSLQSYDTWQDVLRNTEVHGWYQRMADAVGPSSQQHKVFSAPSAVLNPPPPKASSAEKR